ncbi:MAG: c(7)-type cytochrome triheme domain-containing protein [Betaproteobacteria bacterium]
MGIQRNAGWSRRRRALLLALIIVSQVSLAAEIARRWVPLAKDGIHDPKIPALRILQEPRAALSRLPADHVGNQVNWVSALEDGHINPRTNIRPETKVRMLDLDILLNLRGGTPIVRFPHRQHTLWLDCSNCHEHLFKSKAGATTFSMERILQGEQCGVCHGAVSFPLTACARCHNTARDKPLPAAAVRGS